MEFQRDSGMVLCYQCKKPVEGLAIIGYEFDSDYVENVIIIHQECSIAFLAKKKGLAVPCPKCETKGKTKGFNMGEIFTNLGPRESVTDRLLQVSKICDLCDGQGFLAKEPIPVVTDWKKA